MPACPSCWMQLGDDGAEALVILQAADKEDAEAVAFRDL